jgi:diguanylate cyclase (GGDEF)-like protein
MTLLAKFGVASGLIAILVILLATLGAHALSATDDLIIHLYDRPLMGVNYARAANTTLAEARALTSQRRMLEPKSSLAAAAALHKMEKVIADDLTIVRERMGADNVTTALAHAQAAVGDWFLSERAILSPPPGGSAALPMPATIERQSTLAVSALNDLVDLVAANGFAYRTRAKAEIHAANASLAVMAGCIILLSALLVTLFARLIIRPIRVASRVAEEVAAGNITTIDTANRRDEIGRLMRNLAIMQVNLLSRHRETQGLLQQNDRTAEALRRINLRFDTALNNMSHGLLMCDATLQVVVINRRFCEIYGIDQGAISADASYHRVLTLMVAAGNYPGRGVDELIAERLAALKSGQRVTMISPIAAGRTVAISIEPMPDGGWIATHEDVTERQQTEASIAFMACHDALTKLPNRALFRERLEHAIAMAARGVQFAVLCLDLDNFKAINDTMGHPVGDGLLVAVGDRLQACVREADTVARLGGDEFAIIQLAVRQPDNATILTKRIMTAFRQPFDIDGHQIKVGTSIGVSLSPGDGLSYETLMRNADIALYLAKTEGRGTARFFEPEMDARIHLRRVLEMDLQSAIARDEFELYYQPQVSLISNKIIGFEALLRWHHPSRGFVSPLEFIPLAEASGLIHSIGEWVLRTACYEAENWPEDIRVAVNLSPIQVKKAGLSETVQAALAASGLRPDRLELEITESVFLRDTGDTLIVLHQLRAMGIGVALDDFGTGYSSLSYLHSFPFSKIKIDQSFVRNLTTNKESMSIIRAVIGLGESLGIRTIAEGVETQEQLTRLRAEGCSEIQGYFFSRPAPVSELPFLIERLQHIGEGAGAAKG